MTPQEWQALTATAQALWPRRPITRETAATHYDAYAHNLDVADAAEALQRLSLTENEYPTLATLKTMVNVVIRDRQDAAASRGLNDGYGPNISLDQYLATPRGKQQLESNQFLQRYVAHKQKGATTDNAFASAMQRPTPSPN